MVETPDKGDKKRPTAILHIPVWVGAIGMCIILAFFIIVLSISGKNRAIYKGVRLTATRQWVEAGLTLTGSAQNQQGTATESAQATQTTTPTPTEPPATPTPMPTETPALEAGSTQISSVDGMTILFVPAGSFNMGYEGGDTQNKPVHEVYLDNFWIDQTEISVKMYAQCVTAGKCTEPASFRSLVARSYYGNPQFENEPVVNVSWYQAKEYCEWAGRQLPTEAQWEKAARGDDGRLYPWGNKLSDDRGNFSPYKNGYSHIGSYPSGASPYGALQMSGNVYEWVADWFDKGFYQISGNSVNPPGPSEGSNRSVRGGFFRKTDRRPAGLNTALFEDIKGGFDLLINFQSVYRMSLKPEGFSSIIGIRCSAEAQ